MPELTALVETINQLNNKLDGTQESLDRIDTRLDRLPEKYLPRDEAKVKADRIKKMIAGVVVGGIIVASTLGISLYMTHQTTCGVRGVLTLAKTASSRNPIPEGLSDEQRADVERRRAEATAFYDNALNKLPIIWGCS